MARINWNRPPLWREGNRGGVGDILSDTPSDTPKEDRMGQGLYKAPNLRSIAEQCDSIIMECERAKALLAGESVVELLERDNSKPSVNVDV